MHGQAGRKEREREGRSRIYRWTDGWTDRRTDGWIDKQMEDHTNGMDGQTDRQTLESEGERQRGTKIK